MRDETYAELHVSHEPNPVLWLVLNTPKKSAMFNLNNVACERRGVFIEAVGAIIQYLDGDGGGRYVLTTAKMPGEMYNAMKEDRDRLQDNINALRQAQAILLDENRAEVAALKRRIEELETDPDVHVAIAARDARSSTDVVAQVHKEVVEEHLAAFKCRCSAGRPVEACPGNVCGGDYCNGEGRYHNHRLGVSVCDLCLSQRNRA